MSEKLVCPMEDPSPLGGAAGGRILLVAKAAVDMGIGAAALLVNAFLLLAVLPGLVRCRRGRPSKMLVMSLTTADALGGAMQLHYHITQNVCPLAHRAAASPAYCLAKCLGVVFPALLSINSLAAIGVDRYLCIVHSLRYECIMTTRRAWCMIAAVWTLSWSATFSLAVDHRWRPPETACTEEALIFTWRTLSIGLPMNAAAFLVLVVTHLCIRREVGRSEALRVSVRSGGGGVRRGRRHSRSSVKSARVLMLVVGCYGLAFLPVAVVMVLRMMQMGNEKVLELTFRLTYSLTNLNYVANPFTYAWKNAPLKADMLALWARCCRCCRRASASTLPVLPTARHRTPPHARSCQRDAVPSALSG